MTDTTPVPAAEVRTLSMAEQVAATARARQTEIDAEIARQTAIREGANGKIKDLRAEKIEIDKIVTATTPRTRKS